MKTIFAGYVEIGRGDACHSDLRSCFTSAGSSGDALHPVSSALTDKQQKTPAAPPRLPSPSVERDTNQSQNQSRTDARTDKYVMVIQEPACLPLE